MTDATSRGLRAGWAAVLCGAVAVRVAALLCAARLPLFTHLRLDNLIYHEAARRLVAGDLTLGREVVHMSPGYTAFMGAVYATLGEGPWAWRLAQLALGVCTVALVGDAATSLLGRRWGLVAGAVAAAYGPFIFYEQQLLPETLSTALHAALLALAVRCAADATGSGRWALRAASLGVLWGACVLVRPNALLLGAPLLLGLAWSRPVERARWRTALVVAVAAALTIAPMTARNRVVAGEWVLVTDSGGLNFFLGNGRGAQGTFRVPPEVPAATSAQTQFEAFRGVAERDAGRRLTSREVDAYWFARSFADIRRRPLRWARLLLEKAWLFWNAREIPNTEDYSFVRVLNPVLRAPLVQFGAVAPLALLGTLMWLARRRRAEVVVAGVNLALMAALVGFFVLAHYRLPAVPGLILAAVGFVQAAVGFARGGDRRRLAACAVAIAATLPVVFAPKLPKPFDDEWYKLGVAYHRQERLTDAERAYREALRVDPRHLSAHKNLAILRETLGDTATARAEWQRVLSLATAAGRASYVAEATAHLRALPAPR